MPFPRPKLTELDSQLVADIESRLEGTDPRLRRSYLGAISRGVSGALHELYGYLAWIVRQVVPQSADADGLLSWAELYGIRRIDPKRATGAIAVTGAAGTTIPAGTVWRSGAAQDYRATAEGTIGAGGTATVAVEASSAGAGGNAADGTVLSLTSPISGVVSTGAASGAIAGGANIESLDRVLERLLARIQNAPAGGAEHDYRAWAKEAHPDVTTVWPRRNTPTLGQVTVYLMTYDATDNGIPHAAVLTAVRNYIDRLRPATATVTVAAPVAVPLNLTITSLQPESAAVKAAIEAEIKDLLRRESAPGGTILVSHIREAISTAEGETDHTLTAPVADVTHLANRIAVPGTITWE